MWSGGPAGRQPGLLCCCTAPGSRCNRSHQERIRAGGAVFPLRGSPASPSDPPSAPWAAAPTPGHNRLPTADLAEKRAGTGQTAPLGGEAGPRPWPAGACELPQGQSICSCGLSVCSLSRPGSGTCSFVCCSLSLSLHLPPSLFPSFPVSLPPSLPLSSPLLPSPSFNCKLRR